MQVALCHMGAENLGLEYLSAVLKSKGHNVSLIFDPALFVDKYYLNIKFLAKLFDKRKRLIQKIIKLKPDIIAFTVLTDTYKWACDFAKEIKKNLPDIPIVFGGVHPTSVPEEVIKNDFVDAICIGEAEEAFLEFVDNPKRTDIKNFWFKNDKNIIKNDLRPLNQDLDSLPFADKSLFEKEVNIKDCYIIATNRSCPFNCTYCFNNCFKSLYKNQKTVRQRSVNHVIDELKLAKKRYKIRSIYFVDDVFCTNIDYIKKFFKEYKKDIDLPFKVISHPAVINNEMVDIFKKSGCFNIEIGIQSMCEKTRKDILKRYESNNIIKRAINILEKKKIKYTLHHMFGLPLDDYKKLLVAAEFYCNLKNCSKIDCYWLSYFPKTEIIDISKRYGLIDENDIKAIEKGEGSMYFNGGSVKNKEMIRLCKNFDIFFQLMPSLPNSLNKFIYKKRLFNYFNILPNFSIIIFNLINAVIKRDLRTFDYIKYYFNHIIEKRSGV